MFGDSIPSSAHRDLSEGTAPFMVSKPPQKGEPRPPAEEKVHRSARSPMNEDDSLAFHAKRCSVLMVAGLVNGVRHVVVKAENLFVNLKRRCARSSKLRKVRNVCYRAHRAIKKQLETPSPLDYTLSPTSEGASSLYYSSGEEHNRSNESLSERWLEDAATGRQTRLHIRWIPDVPSDGGSSFSESCSFREFFRTLQRAKEVVEKTAEDKVQCQPVFTEVLEYKPAVDEVSCSEKKQSTEDKPELSESKANDEEVKDKEQPDKDGLESKLDTVDQPITT